MGAMSRSGDGSEWGATALVFAVIGGAVAIAAGLYLCAVDSEVPGSLAAHVAHGVGIYCIGRGIYMIASPFLFRSGVGRLNRPLD